MIKNLDVVDRIPFEAAAIAEADEYLQDVAIAVFEKGNVALELAKKQAAITTRSGKRGVSVVILQCVLSDELPEVRFGPMKIHVSMQVIENVELNNDANGTKKSCRKVARRLVQIFKAARLDGLTTDWECDKPAIEPISLTGPDGKLAAGLVGNQVNFITFEADTEGLEQVSAPTFSDVDNLVALSCATDGAEIWYTTDESVPVPGTTNPSGTAKFYTDPIEVPAEGIVIRAAAFKAGCIGSTVSRAEVEQV